MSPFDIMQDNAATVSSHIKCNGHFFLFFFLTGSAGINQWLQCSPMTAGSDHSMTARALLKHTDNVSKFPSSSVKPQIFARQFHIPVCKLQRA